MGPDKEGRKEGKGIKGRKESIKNYKKEEKRPTRGRRERKAK